MNIEELLSKRKQTQLFYPDKIPDKEIAEKIIKTAFKITASKQNLYPYKIHVLGPNNKKEKTDFYNIVSNQKGGAQNINVKYAPYCLIFTIKLVTNPDLAIFKRISQGHPYDVCDPKKYKFQKPSVAIEVGMFAKVLTSLALEQGLDVAYTGCFPDWHKDSDIWKKLDFIDDDVIFAMQFGYRINNIDCKKYKLQKPEIDEVINWV